MKINSIGHNAIVIAVWSSVFYYFWGYKGVISFAVYYSFSMCLVPLYRVLMRAQNPTIPIYHFTSAEDAKSILANGFLPPNQEFSDVLKKEPKLCLGQRKEDVVSFASDYNAVEFCEMVKRYRKLDSVVMLSAQIPYNHIKRMFESIPVVYDSEGTLVHKGVKAAEIIISRDMVNRMVLSGQFNVVYDWKYTSNKFIAITCLIGKFINIFGTDIKDNVEAIRHSFKKAHS